MIVRSPSPVIHGFEYVSSPKDSTFSPLISKVVVVPGSSMIFWSYVPPVIVYVRVSGSYEVAAFDVIVAIAKSAAITAIAVTAKTAT